MTKTPNLHTRHWIVLFILLVIISYALFQARFLLLGPRVWIDAPVNGELLTSPVVEIAGRAKNIAWIELNGRQIFTDEEGRWSEKLLVATGTSIMTVKVRDRYSRERVKRVEVMYKFESTNNPNTTNDYE